MTVAEKRKKKYLRLANRYVGISLFCVLFSLIYSLFSHGIHSRYMSWMFLWPLVLGALPAGLAAFGFLPPAEAAGEGMKDLYRFGIAALTVAGMLKGVLEIAGNDSVYTSILMGIGAVLVLAGAGAGIVSALKTP